MKFSMTALLATFVLFLAQSATPFPTEQIKFGMFTARFGANGRFTIDGKDWPSFKGTWKRNGAEIELIGSERASGCDRLARYRFLVEGNRLSFNLISDDCAERRLVLDQSSWIPSGDSKPVTVRRILRTTVDRTSSLPEAGSSAGGWPSIRGAEASGVAAGQSLPDVWDAKSGNNMLWRTPIPGLAHSSPIVWGDRIFVTSAISSKPNASFRPGLYGDGDSSDDRSQHRFMVYAIDKRSGKILW